MMCLMAARLKGAEGRDSAVAVSAVFFGEGYAVVTIINNIAKAR